MGFLLLGVLLLVLKYFEIGFVAGWDWWWVLAPFALAFVYWEILDPALHISKKREMRKMAERKDARVQKLKEANHPHLRRKGRR